MRIGAAEVVLADVAALDGVPIAERRLQRQLGQARWTRRVRRLDVGIEQRRAEARAERVVQLQLRDVCKGRGRLILERVGRREDEVAQAWGVGCP